MPRRMHGSCIACPPTAARKSRDEMMDGERSIVFPQAGNRMHVQKALLKWLLL